MSVFETSEAPDPQEAVRIELADQLLAHGQLTEFMQAAIKRFRAGTLLATGEGNAVDLVSQAIESIKDPAEQEKCSELYHVLFSDPLFD